MELIGYSEEDAATLEEIWELAFPDPEKLLESRERWESALINLPKVESRIDAGEYVVTCKDGSLRYVNAVALVLEDGYQVILTDFTEHKQIEERYRQLFDNMKSCVAIYRAVGILESQPGYFGIGWRLRIYSAFDG